MEERKKKVKEGRLVRLLMQHAYTISFTILISGCGTWSPNAPLSLHKKRTQTNPEISGLPLGKTPDFGELVELLSFIFVNGLIMLTFLGVHRNY